MKLDENFFNVWGGISSVQHTLSLLLTGGLQRNAPLELIGNLLGANVAGRFKVPNKGRIAVGYDADLALVDLRRDFSVRAEDLLYHHRQSPYVGRALRGKVVRTFLRGQTIFLDDKIVAKAGGHLIKPAR
jgi:allantoinase